MYLTRREHLRTLGGCLLSVASCPVPKALSQQSAAPALPSLRDAAAAAGLAFGSDSDVWFRNTRTMLYVGGKPTEQIDIPSIAWRDLLIQQCGLYAPILSWAEIAPDPAHEDDGRDQNIPVMLAAGLQLTGGHLLWYLRTPRWLEALPRADAERAAAEHIQRLVGAYRGRVFSWNVVNEAIEPRQNGPAGLRVDNPLVRALGYDFFAPAFHQARAADPAALLLYNDYGMELDTPGQEARRTALLHLLDRLQEAQAPIDGVGLQSHLQLADFHRFDERLYRNFLRELAGRGLKIAISELDVDDRGAPADTPVRDRQVAEVYSRFLAVALDEPQVVALVTWGLTDAYSWYNGRYFPEYARPDGLPQRPLLFDRGLHPKPAFYAVLHALQNAPRRTPV